MSHLPKPPRGWRPLTFSEARTPIDLDHNRRLGWMLALARTGTPLPPPGDSLEAKAALVLAHLPDLFPDVATAADYVHDEADREIAAAILASSDE